VEVNPKSQHLIINVNPKQAENIRKNRYGGTMRLGPIAVFLKKGSKVQKLYGAQEVSERTSPPLRV